MSESNIKCYSDKRSDEIDIFEFSFRLWQAFRKLLVNIRDAFVGLVIFLIRKSLWIFSFALVGFLYTIYLIYGASLSTTYVSSLRGHAKVGSVDVIEHINKLDRTNKSELLASFLKITEDQAKEIKGIKAFFGVDVNKNGIIDYVDFRENFDHTDTTIRRDPHFVHIQALVHNEDILPLLQERLLTYVNTDDYLKNMYEVINRIEQEEIKQLEFEMLKIDSLQYSQFKQVQNRTNSSPSMYVMANNLEQQTFHKEQIQLLKLKHAKELSHAIYTEPLSVISGFSALSIKEVTNRQFAVRNVLISGGIGLLCALLWHRRKRIIDLIRQG